VTSADRIRVALVDDHVLLRNGLRQILETVPDLVVVAEAGDSEGAVQAALDAHPNVMLLDVEMPGDDVTMTVRRIRDEAPDTRILILSMYDGAQLMRSLLDLGVHGCLLKSISANELISAIRAVFHHPERVVLSMSHESVTAMHGLGTARLTARETEVLKLTAQALSNAQIGREVGLTESTVKRHLHNIFGKLGAVSRVDAVNKGLDAGYLSRGDTHR
jgi:DNA-binding NarL/FixJ family response regulator